MKNGFRNQKRNEIKCHKVCTVCHCPLLRCGCCEKLKRNLNLSPFFTFSLVWVRFSLTFRKNWLKVSLVAMMLRFFSWTRVDSIGVDVGSGPVVGPAVAVDESCCSQLTSLTFETDRRLTLHFYISPAKPSHTHARARTHLVVGRTATRARERRDSSLARGSNGI